MPEQKIIAIRIRGGINLNKDIKGTLDLLRLYRQNYCVILDDTPSIRGMLNKVKDFITYGETNEETIKALFEKRGREYKGRVTDSKGIIKYKKFIEFNNKKYKLYFRLNPPRKGFERKGVKTSFTRGGALGYRKDKINDLVMRML